MDWEEGVVTPAILRQIPELKKLLKLKIENKEYKQQAKQFWKENNIDYEDWFLPYFCNNFIASKDIKRPCLQYNDPMGYGCSKNPCSGQHECMICGKINHGAFWTDASLYPRCQIVRKQDEELLILEKNNISIEKVEQYLEKRDEEEEPLDDNDGFDDDDGGDDDIDLDFSEVRVVDFNFVKGNSRFQFKNDLKSIIDQTESATVVRGTMSVFGIEKEVAVKLYSINRFNKTEASSRLKKFKEELKFLKKLRDRSTTPELFVTLLSNTVQDTSHKDFLFLVLELCENNLGQFVMDRKGIENDFSLNLRKQFTRDILQAYKSMHTCEIAHRDVKPQNILVKRIHNCYQIKICDFQVSKYDGDGYSTNSTVISTFIHSSRNFPTSCWFSPEVIETHLFDGKSSKEGDLWPLGGVIAFLISKGHILFDTIKTVKIAAENHQYLKDRLEEIIEFPLANDLIARLCKRNPEQRLPLQKAVWHPFLWTPNHVLEILNGLVDWCNTPKESDCWRSMKEQMDAQYHWCDDMEKMFPGCKDEEWAKTMDWEETYLSCCCFLGRFFEQFLHQKEHQEGAIEKIAKEKKDFFPWLFDLLMENNFLDDEKGAVPHCPLNLFLNI